MSDERLRPSADPPVLERAQFDESSDALILFDRASGHLVDINSAVVQMTGSGREAILNRPLAELLVHRRPEVLARLMDAIRAVEPLRRLRGFRIRSADGQSHAVTLTLSFPQSDGPNPLGLIAARPRRSGAAPQSGRRHSRHWRRVIESLSDCVWTARIEAGPRWRYLYVSPVVERITGRSAASFRGDRAVWLDIVHPDDRARVRNSDKALLHGQRNASRAQYQYRIVRANGSVGWVQENVRVTRRADGTARIDGVLADVTNRIELEQSLRVSEERLHRIVESNPGGVLLLDADGRVRFANLAAARLFGLAREQLTRRSWNDLDLEKSDSGRSARLQERILRRPDGSRSVVACSLVKLRTPDGAPDGTVVSFADVTERRAAEESLRLNERRFRTLVETGSDAVALLAPDGIILYASGSLKTVMGFDPAEVVGHNGMSWLHPDDRAAAESLVGAGPPLPGLTLRSCFRIRHRDGSFRDIEAVITNHLDDPAVQALVVNFRDITDRQRAEQIIREQDARLHLLLEQMPCIVWSVNEDLQFTSSLGAGLAHLGLTPNQVVGRTLFDYVQTDDPDHPIIASARHALRGETTTYETIWMGRHFSIHCRPLCDSDGVAIGAVSVALDVTDQRNAEEARRASEARYRLLFERNLAGVFRSTPDNQLIECNDAGARMLGYERADELIGGSILPAYFSPADRNDFVERLRAHRTLTNIELRLRHRSGYELWALTNSTWIDGPDGPRIECTIIDITERKRAGEALAEQNALVRGLLNAMPDMVSRKDPHGRYLGCNPAFGNFVGLPEHDVVGRTDADLFTPEVAADVRLADVATLAAGRPMRREEWLTAPDGRRVLFETLRTLLRATDGRRFDLLAVSRDITDRRSLEEQLRQAQKLEAVGQLAGGVAHDFNNLLTAVLGNLSLAGAMLPDGHPVNELLGEAERAGDRAAELTRQLLGFARRAPVKLAAVDVAAAFAETAGLLRRTIDPRIRLEVAAPSDLPAAWADRGQVQQVLMNLCLNARDAMPLGGTLRMEAAAVRLRPGDSLPPDAVPGDYVRVTVADTGIGMSPEVRARLFEPFFTTKALGEGTGLGLAVVYGIVKQHNGFVACRSEVGQGTTFDIYLPQAAEGAAMAPIPVAVVGSGGRETVLLVDDEAMVRSLARTVLEELGYRVLVAADGLEAVDVYRHNVGSIDLVVMDLTMPRMSGVDATNAIMAVNPSARVLLSSGYGSEYPTAAALPGVRGFVAKPYRPVDLAAAVREVLDQ